MSFSSSVDAFRIADATFAAAYDALGDKRRSVLKKWISQLYLFWGRERSLCRTQIQQWDQGVTTHECVRPLDWTLFVLSPDFSSPAQLLAALLPALLAGVPRVVVAREEAEIPFPAPLLACMELAGQELVLEMNAASILEMTGAMFAESRRGKVCFLGKSPVMAPVRNLLPERAFLGLATSGTTGGIWFDGCAQWDTQTLAWTLPDTVFCAGGDVPESMDNGLKMRLHSSSEKDFWTQDFDVLYTSDPSSQGRCPCVFGPGQEGGWFWPDLTPRIFMDTAMSWQVDLREQAGEDDHGLI
jgi:hypothetical protein